MTLSASGTQPLAHAAADRTLRWSGRTLALVRMLWVIVVVAATSSFLLALPFRWAMLTTTPSPSTLANLTALGLAPTFFAAYSLFWELIIAVPFVLVGLIIFWRCGDERFALLASLVLIVFGVGNGTLTPTIRALLGHNPALDLLIHSFQTIAWYGFGIFFYLFPNGRFVPAGTRWLAAIWLPITLLWNFASNTPFAPLNWPIWLAVPLVALIWASWVVSQIYRYRKVSSAIERQQTKWIVAAIAAIVLTWTLIALVGSFVPGFDLMGEEQPSAESFAYMLGHWLLSPVIATLPVALAFSIMRYRLWDIDRLISRAVVYTGLTSFVVMSYVLIVGGLGTLLQARGNLFISLLATGAIAMLFNPLRVHLERLVNRLMYGDRDDPYAVLSRFSQRLESTLTSEAILPTIVEMVAQTLKVPYVAILLRNNGTKDEAKVAAAVGAPASHPLALPLSYQHQIIGELQVAPRAPDESFTPTEQRLLYDIAAQTGVAVHNVRLTSDLKRSRMQLVTAREEERRRLRRDLHDGLGPKLAGQTLKLEVALDLLDEDTAGARALLLETMAESQIIMAEIRQLVYGLRPPALDQLGLLTAVREQAAHYQLSGLQVTVHAPPTLPLLPAAVEVAAYRIIQESLTNVARHAQATRCSVSLVMGRELEIVITDDGRGMPPEVRVGVGLVSMRERAEEIGGQCMIDALQERGTRLVAKLPVTS